MFGVPPTEPPTGFGYIECGRARPEVAPGAYEVLRFRAKPNAETARQFLEAGNFFWNSGMFFWTTAALLEAFAAHQPAMARAVERLEAAWGAPRRKAEAREAFASMEKLRLTAILERAANRLCLRANSVGGYRSWTALAASAPRHASNTVMRT
jgi:mannose-1-phosphate guanylyltransferase